MFLNANRSAFIHICVVMKAIIYVHFLISIQVRLLRRRQSVLSKNESQNGAKKTWKTSSFESGIEF